MRLKTVAAWILIFSLLLDNMFLPFDLGFDFRVQYIIFSLAIPFYLLLFKITINPKIFLFLFLTAAFLLFTPLVAGTPIIGAVRQLLLIFICFLPFYFMLASYQFDFKAPFRIYLLVSAFISLVAIIQFFSFVFGFKPGYDFSYLGFDMSRLDPSSYRVQGWMMEPSFLAYFLMPAGFFSMVKLFNVIHSQIRFRKIACFLILFAMVLTGSLICYLGIVLMIMIIISEKYSFIRNPMTLFILGMAVVILSVGFYNMSAFVKRRVDDTVKIFSHSAADYASVNLSTLHFYNNFLVTWKTMEEHPFTGTGFGNYYVMYNEYAMPVEGSSDITPDGSSLFFRLITETGIPFSLLFLILVFLLRSKLRTTFHSVAKDAWIINNGIFILIVMRLIRMPHYVILGFPFFLTLYYLTYKEVKKEKKSRQQIEGR